jgi:hypothetical protein
MAKSGQISGNGAAVALIEDVSGAEAPIMTLGTLCAAILQASPVERKLEVDLENRTVSVYGGAEPLDDATKTLAVLTLEDGTKKTGTWAAVNGAQANPSAPAIVARDKVKDATALPVKPSRSMASLVNAIDDALPGNDAFRKLVIDQSAGEVLFGADTLFFPANPEAIFSQQVQDTLGNPSFAFE